MDGELHGRRIFVAEDDFMLAVDLAEVLEGAGATVVGPVGKVSDGLALIERHGQELDGAVLDIDMRGGASYKLADALMKLGVGFVFTTGYSASAVAEAYRGFQRCEKPVVRAALLAALGRV